MATKMNAEIAKRVKALGINAGSEESARKELLKILEKNGIPEMEEEDTATLIEIAESFIEDDSKESEDNDATEDNDEAADLAEEVTEEEEAEESEEEESEDEAEESDVLAPMSRTELKAYIKEQSLGIKVKKSWSDDDIREAIRTAEASIKDNEPAEEEEPAKEEKKAEKKSAKKETKKAEKPAAKEEKPAKKVGKRGTKLDPKNNEEDRKEFNPLKEVFPEDQYLYAWTASAGVTIKYIGKNSHRAVLLVENCSKQADESVKCNVYFPTFTKHTDWLDEAGIEYGVCWSGAPYIKGITMAEGIEMAKTMMSHIEATVQKIDKRLGENKAKMEDSLNKKAAKPTKEEEEPAKEEKKAEKKSAKKETKKISKK